jgi:two-component system response regulator AtoC
MARVRLLVDAASSETCPVFLMGETGAGKGYHAERIHARSSRAMAPLVHVFGGALAADAIDSFSPASATVLGAARGGALLIDEVEELTPAAQARLFHLLERQARAGTPDVRILATTNRDPARLAASPEFRRDLFFRLSALTIAVPPLRARRGEIASLARTFIAETAMRLGRPPPDLAEEAEAALLSYAWPGNVRQLRSVLAAATIAAHDGAIRREGLWLPASPPHAPEPSQPISVRRHASGIRAVGRELIAEALARTGGNQSEAARYLGISRRTLINRIEQFDLPRPRKRASDEG